MACIDVHYYMHMFFNFMKHHRKAGYLCCRSVCSVGTQFMGARASCPLSRAALNRSLIPRIPYTETETETVELKLQESQVKPLFDTVISAPPFSCTSFRRLHAGGENRKEVVDVIDTPRWKSCLSSLVPSLAYLQAPPPLFSHVTEGAQHPQERLGQADEQRVCTRSVFLQPDPKTKLSELGIGLRSKKKLNFFNYCTVFPHYLNTKVSQQCLYVNFTPYDALGRKLYLFQKKQNKKNPQIIIN